MKVSTFSIRVWRILSIAGFLIALFSSYISYPSDVAVRFDDQGVAIQYVDRETLFYVAIAIFIVNNALLNLVARLFLRIPTASLPVPNQPLWATHRDQLNEVFTNWFQALMAAINTILALSLVVLSLLNRSDRMAQWFDYVWLLPLSTIMLMVVLAALPIRLFMKPASDV